MKTLNKQIFITLCIITVVLIGLGCGKSGKNATGTVSEGVIVYEAAPLDMGHPFASYAPSEMTIKFKDNNCAASMSAGLGALTALFITSGEEHTFTQVIKLFSDTYVVIQNEEELKKENAFVDMEIKPTDETKMIAGYKCKKAIVNIKGEEPVQYDIYYTNEINIENSNFANPYSKLDGVLMEYRMQKFGLEMQFSATAVKKEKVEDEAFTIPEDAEQITQEELTNKLKAFE
ncbi:MAG: hypothetical protein WBM13_12830 [Bacteroidia bacterium]